MKYFILISFITIIVFFILGKITENKRVIFHKNMFIVNDKYLFNINEMIAPVIKNIKIATNGRQIAIVSLELILNYEDKKELVIKNFDDCKNILIKMKTYNKSLYDMFLSIYPKVIVETIEKELD